MERRFRSGGSRRRGAVQSFQFQDVNLPLLWARLTLTATQLSKLTGVSRRQVEWWRRRGYLTPSPEAPDRFNGDAVTLVMLIKQAIDSGVPLHRAYQFATNHLAMRLSDGVSQATSGPGERPDETALLDLEQKLLAAYNTIGLVLKAIEPLANQAESEFAEQSVAR
ncbi:MAG TPA: MerR family transcriptional regulator [Chloroflexota bacterium]|jgi:DNA-binding transcriptional MerR regulator